MNKKYICAPSRGISDLASRLLTSETDPERQLSLSAIINTAETLSFYMNEFAETTHAYINFMPVQLQHTNLNHLVENTINAFSAYTQENNIRLIIHPLDTFSQIICDKLRLQHIFLNLLHHVISHALDQSCEIQLREQHTRKPTENLDFIITAHDGAHDSFYHNNKSTCIKNVERLLRDIKGHLEIVQTKKYRKFICTFPVW